VAYCLSAVVSAISLVARGWITIDQLRQRRRDISEVDAPRPYLQRLNAKIKDGQRTVNMVASHPAHALTPAHARTSTHRPMNCRDDVVRVAQACLGLALALCEDGPMAGISMYFFVQRYQIPVFQVRRPCSQDTRFTLAAAVYGKPELMSGCAGVGHQPVHLGRHARAQARASHRAARDVGQALEVALEGAASLRGC